MRQPVNSHHWPIGAQIDKRRAFAVAGGCLLVALITSVRAGSIFDDNFKPAPGMPAQPVPKAPEEPAPAPRLPPAPSPGETPSPTPTPELTPATRIATRRPIPVAKDIAGAEKLVKQVFANEYKVHTTAGKAALGRTLLNESRQSQDPLTLYVLFRETRDLASAGGDGESALEAVRGLRDRFAFGDKAIADMEHATLKSAAGNICTEPPTNPPRPEIHADIMALMGLAERDLAGGDYASAAQVAAQAVLVTHKSNDASLADRVGARAALLQNIFIEYGRARDALATLKTNPADPAANVTAGKFQAFACDRVDVGMACLAKGNDPALKALATQELAAPTDAAQQTSLADGWAAAMKSASGTARDAMRRRAIYWYDQAAGQANGLGQITAAKRSNDLRVLNLKHGLVGEYFRATDFGAHVFTRVDPKIEFYWNGRKPDDDLPAEYFSIRLTGFIKAAVPGTYQLVLVHDDGARIWLDGQLILDKWGGNCGRDTVSVQLTGAAQSLKVEYEQLGGDSSFGLGWTPPGTNKVQAVPLDALYHSDQPAAPVLETAAYPGKDGAIALMAGWSTLHNALTAAYGIYGGTVGIGGWHSIATVPSWEFVAPSGDYDIAISYSADQYAAGAEFVALVGEGRFAGHIEDTGGWSNFRQQALGRIHLEAGGHTVWLIGTKKAGGDVMCFGNITLTPVQGGGK